MERPGFGFSPGTALMACLLLGTVVAYAITTDGFSTLRGKTSDQELARLAGTNQRLMQEIEQLRMRQAHDGAALAALQKDYAIQVEALRQANRNLAFYRKNVPGVVPTEK